MDSDRYEYAVKVFTLHPENYDADAAGMSSWLTKRAGDGWAANAVTTEILPTGVIVAIALATKKSARPTQGDTPTAP